MLVCQLAPLFKGVPLATATITPSSRAQGNRVRLLRQTDYECGNWMLGARPSLYSSESETDRCTKSNVKQKASQEAFLA